ncbi:hypothetical protein CBER1_01431 [Cercospora berteroae]|uniref:BTB domain-containing protein n=1 Tax=Cercospora berteroae TaxID=357750 RepID=A0A2S6CCG0_9PEZI|nr:hypothetical protein CBER1_01431 [Cercospora berteroae]
MSGPPDFVEISSDGDVILVCGEQFQNGQVKKLKVSSAALSLGSSGMKTMFKPHFKEGTDLRRSVGGSPLEVSLPEDDPLAMEIICYVLHLRNDKVNMSNELSAECILRVAMASDKYDCRIAMMYFAQTWLSRASTDEQELHVLFTAAYLFGNNEAFRRLGRGLVLELSSHAFVAATEYAREHLQAALRTIDWKRKKIRKSVHAAIGEVIDARSTLRKNSKVPHTCVPGCGIAEICLAEFIQSLKQSDLYPLKAIKTLTIERLRHNTMRADHVPPKEALACASPDCIGRTQNLSKGCIPYLFFTGFDMEHTLVGPCLTCFREDELDRLEGCKHFEVRIRDKRKYHSPEEVIRQAAS